MSTVQLKSNWLVVYLKEFARVSILHTMLRHFFQLVVNRHVHKLPLLLHLLHMLSGENPFLWEWWWWWRIVVHHRLPLVHSLVFINRWWWFGRCFLELEFLWCGADSGRSAHNLYTRVGFGRKAVASRRDHLQRALTRHEDWRRQRRRYMRGVG